MVTLRHIQLRNCSGVEEVQFFRKAAGVTLVLEDVVQVGGREKGSLVMWGRWEGGRGGSGALVTPGQVEGPARGRDWVGDAGARGKRIGRLGRRLVNARGSDGLVPSGVCWPAAGQPPPPPAITEEGRPSSASQSTQQYGQLMPVPSGL